jgi:hypothetical protein
MLMILSLSIACSSGSAPSGAQTPASPASQAGESGVIAPATTATATPVASAGENGGESKPAGQAASTSPAAAAPPISPEDRVPRISVDEARQLLAANQAVMVDVRAQDIYEREHIKGAINVPLAQLEAGNYKALPHHKRIITYCT